MRRRAILEEAAREPRRPMRVGVGEAGQASAPGVVDAPGIGVAGDGAAGGRGSDNPSRRRHRADPLTGAPAGCNPPAARLLGAEPPDPPVW